MIQFHKAERTKSKLRLGMAGPAGSGKTYSSLLIAFGLDRDAYRAYCLGKYEIKAMEELTADQREEQIRILNSLKNPERLKGVRAGPVRDHARWGQSTAGRGSPGCSITIGPETDHAPGQGRLLLGMT